VADVVGRNLRLRVARLIEAHAADGPRHRLEARFLRVADFRLVGATAARRTLAFLVLAREPLLPDSELHRRVPVLRLVRYGKHSVRLGLDDRDRNLLSLLVED